MIAVILIAAGMCLQGGEQVDVSRYVSATARLLELKVTLKPANGHPGGLLAGLRRTAGAIQSGTVVRLDTICGTHPEHQEHWRPV